MIARLGVVGGAGDYKEAHEEDLCVNGVVVLYRDCGGGYLKIHV